MLKTTALFVFCLWLINKSLKNSKRLVDHIKKCSFFSDSQYGARSSQSTHRIAGDFNRVGAASAIGLVISKAYNRYWHASLLHEINS